MSAPSKRRAAAPQSSTEPLAARIAQAPRLAAPGTTRRRMEDWLRPLSRSATGKGLKQVFSAHPQAGALVEGLADGSPFLWDLASREPDRLLRLLRSDPDQAF